MKRTLLALAFAAVLPLSAQASDLSYSYVELDYGQSNLDDTASGVDGTLVGYGLRGSVAVSKSFYLFGAWQTGKDDIPVGGIDYDVSVDQFNLGLGYHHAISDKADLIVELSYLQQDVSLDDFDVSNDDEAVRVSGGIRGQLADNFEGFIKANFTDGGDFEADFGGTVGAQYKFNETWGIVGEAEFAGNSNTYLLGVRASF